MLVRVTRGCPWNRCAFCDMYKQLRFEVREVAEIARDIEALREVWPHARSIFLADSDALVHPRLREIVELVHQTFPEANRVTSYSRLSTLRRLSMEKLVALREAGLTRVHAGLESGSARVLERASKGLTPEHAIRGGRRAVEAGFNVCLYVLCGLGGEDDWQEHARETARVIAEIRPQFVRLRSLALLPGTPLHQEWETKRFQPITPLTRLRETRMLVERLAQEMARASGASGEIEIVSDHFTNYVWVDGELVFGGVNGFVPADAVLMTAEIDRVIHAAQSGSAIIDVGTRARTGRVPHL